MASDKERMAAVMVATAAMTAGLIKLTESVEQATLRVNRLREIQDKRDYVADATAEEIE